MPAINFATTSKWPDAALTGYASRPFTAELLVVVTGIIEAVTGLARKLNMRSVIEGIETRQQLSIVNEIGCDELQGYYFNRPVPSSELAKLLHRGDT